MIMQFSYSNRGNRNATKFMVVAGVHVIVGALFVHSLSTKKISLSLPEPLLVMIEPQTPTPPLPPPEPPKPLQQLAPPDIVIPKQEVVVAAPPEPTVTAVPQTDALPQPSTPAGTASEAPPAANANANANTGQMHSAVFADANSCALPDYPASAARDGATGTTTLALLVGVDGRVSSARIEQSSGSRVLDRAALNALSLCKFKPAMNNGAAQAGWARMAYVWKLD
jgi:protein TonB